MKLIKKMVCSFQVLLFCTAAFARQGAPSFESLQEKIVYEIPAEQVVIVRNQLALNACTYFTVTDLVMESYLAKDQGLKGKALSVTCLMGLRDWMYKEPSYVEIDKPTELPSAKGDGVNVAVTAARLGVPLALNYPELGIDCRDSAPVRDISLREYKALLSHPSNPKGPYGKGMKIAIDKLPSFERIHSLLDKDLPLGLGVPIFYETKSKPVWFWGTNPFDTPFLFIGAHAIQIVGYTSNGYLKFKNSWGSSWGVKGYGFIQEDYLTKAWSKIPQLKYIGYSDELSP